MANKYTNTAAELEVIGGLIVQRLGDQLDANNTNASGSLKGSITLHLKPNGLGMYIDALDYWDAVDEGTRPHTPPRSAILKWLSYPNVRDKLKKGKSDAAFGEREANSIAFLIQRKIKREGTKGTNFFTNVVNSGIFDDMAGALADSMEQDILAILNNQIDAINSR
tara:strand:- start:5012 stop:5509 length:498 start_codon:yes stop_codon:yes gene_type:complete